MNELLEFIEDLNRLETLRDHPQFEEMITEVRAKYENRVNLFEEEMTRQMEMEL